MKDFERRSQVVPDADPYLQAHREMQRLKTARQREWNGLSPDENLMDEVPWQANDEYLQAAKDQLTRQSLLLNEDQRQYFREQIQDARKEYLERRKHARLTVTMADRLGEPVPDDIRALAEGPDLYEQFEAASEKMRASRRKTLNRVLSR